MYIVFVKLAEITGESFQTVFDVWYEAPMNIDWDGSCLNRLDWFEDAIGMDGDGVTAGLVTDDLDSIKSLTARCPAWVECFPSYSEKAAQGEDDILKAVKQFRVEAKRTKKAAVPDRVPLIQFLGARTAAAKTGGGNDSGNGLHI